MSYQPGRIRQNMRPNWVGPISVVMEIAPILRRLGPGYLREQNYSDLLELRCDLTKDELRSPWQQNAWRIRNRGKRIMTYI